MSVESALVAAVRTITDDATFDVSWGSREARARDATHVLLSLDSLVRKGVDERRYEADGDDLTERVYAVRRLAVQFRCEAQQQELLFSAMETAEQIAAGLARTDVIEALALEGIGAPRCQPPRVTDYKDGSRWRSAVVFEAWFPYSRTWTVANVGRVAAVEFSGLVDETIEIGPTMVAPEALEAQYLETSGGDTLETSDGQPLEVTL
jgi:hypothetical protein